MSNFYCPKCGALCEDSPRGYIKGCEHYPPDSKLNWNRRHYYKKYPRVRTIKVSKIEKINTGEESDE